MKLLVWALEIKRLLIEEERVLCFKTTLIRSKKEALEL